LCPGRGRGGSGSSVRALQHRGPVQSRVPPGGVGTQQGAAGCMWPPKRVRRAPAHAGHTRGTRWPYAPGALATRRSALRGCGPRDTGVPYEGRGRGCPTPPAVVAAGAAPRAFVRRSLTAPGRERAQGAGGTTGQAAEGPCHRYQRWTHGRPMEPGRRELVQGVYIRSTVMASSRDGGFRRIAPSDLSGGSRELGGHCVGERHARRWLA